MALIIDGYNLLHAIGLPSSVGEPQAWRQARTGLLNFLAASLEPGEIRTTVVVFDSALSLRHLPRKLVYRGIEVRFSSEHASADELIEELIRLESAPRRLTVVSSDHRVQQAARRRRATAVDSEAWYLAVTERKRRSASESEPGDERDDRAAAEEANLDFWLKAFSTDQEEPLNDVDNPFPPGYADDLEN